MIQRFVSPGGVLITAVEADGDEGVFTLWPSMQGASEQRDSPTLITGNVFHSTYSRTNMLLQVGALTAAV